MMNKAFLSLLVLQFIAHNLSDFYFQWDKMVVEKVRKTYKSKYMYLHFLIGFVISWALSFQIQFGLFALSIALVHLLTDIIKSILEKKEIFTRYLFITDQMIHWITIFIFVYLYVNNQTIAYPDFVPGLKILIIIAGFVFILQPVNFFIKEFFKLYQIPVPKQNDLKNAGKLIGSIERILILIFVLMHQFEAIGFLLAAKSILRYNEQDKDFPNKTEYVLAGTLLSFTFAIVTGIIISQIN